MIKLKRVYVEPAVEDGRRILVERLWPRGMSKDKIKIDEWMKDLAPSGSLRRWFSHDPEKWQEFRSRYRKELEPKTSELKRLAEMAKRGDITFVYSARDEQHNNAVVLKELLEEIVMHKLDSYDED